MRGNNGMVDPRATLTILQSDSLANKRTRTSGSSKQFKTGDTNSSTNLSVSLKKQITQIRYEWSGVKNKNFVMMSNLSQPNAGCSQPKKTAFSFVIIFGCGKVLTKNIDQSADLRIIFGRIEFHNHSAKRTRKYNYCVIIGFDLKLLIDCLYFSISAAATLRLSYVLSHNVFAHASLNGANDDSIFGNF